ncbi:MAG: methionine biosynthesis protein MetW [Spirochaetales bacterium]|nr:methionine biosynthesis protein MetW [Spirochaetales bacterium]
MYKELYKTTTFTEIARIVEPGSRVLDLGCGDGALLDLLEKVKKVSGLGIDIDEEAVVGALERGITAVCEDFDSALTHYKKSMYDYVILSQTLQVVKRPDHLLSEIVRVGKKAIVTFPNFAYYRVRLRLMFGGRMPKSKILPWEWFNTPNIHLLTINDFRNFCRTHGIRILKAVYFGSKVRRRAVSLLSNLLSEEALFVIERKK